MTSSDLMSYIETEKKYVLPTYPKFPFLLVRGAGNTISDAEGKRYLDFYGGHAVCVIGHSHPQLVEAVKRQAEELMFYSNVCYHPARARAAEQLVTKSYGNMAQVYFANSGAEANEVALKIARRVTGRSRVVAMVDGFHGRTIGALSVTGRPKLREEFPDNLSHLTDFVPFGSIEAIRKLDGSRVAAVILEPIQSMAGVRIAPAEFYAALRSHCTEHGIVLVFDEVQTAPARSGTWFVGQNWGVEPDLVTCAKGVGGGFPVGAVLANGEISSQVGEGEQGSTFGGGPLAAAAVAATFEIIARESLTERVRRLSEAAFERFRALEDSGFVRDVRGLGYLMGIQCARPAKDVCRQMRERGILTGSSYEPNTMRLLPPLTLTEEDWDAFFDAFEEVARL